MKTELKAKFLQHLTNKRKDEGFTLIELLVVIIIIGILSAIALPSFLNQAAKARGAEAKSNVGAMNRAQQAYYLEQQSFSSSVDQLGLSFPTTTDNFDYKAVVDTATTSVVNQGTSKKDDIKSYGGGVFYTASTGSGTSAVSGSTSTVLCEANSPGKTALTKTDITLSGTTVSCGTSAKVIK